MERAYQRLRENKVEHASSGRSVCLTGTSNAGGIQAYYFRDPDGHFLEVLAFPPDKGKREWHRETRPVPRIDHTAIVI